MAARRSPGAEAGASGGTVPYRVQPIPLPHPAARPGGALGRQTPRGAQRWPKKLPGTLLPRPAAPPGGTIHASSPGHSGATVASHPPIPAWCCPSAPQGPPVLHPQLCVPEPPAFLRATAGARTALPGPLGSQSPPPLLPSGATAHPNSCSAGSQRGMDPQSPGPSWVTHTHTLTHSWGPAECQPPDSGRAGTPHTADSQAGSPWAVSRVPGAPEQAQAREGRRQVPWRRGPY